MTTRQVGVNSIWGDDLQKREEIDVEEGYADCLAPGIISNYGGRSVRSDDIEMQ